MASKNISVSLPTELLEEMDELCAVEHRNRSELIREAMRRYIASSRVPLQGWQRELLDERLAALQKNPDSAIPWDVARAELWPETS